MPSTVESFAAKTAAKAAGSSASMQGLTGVFNLLAQQHEEAVKLLSRAQGATDPEQRRELWRQVRSDLICHERAELITIYPLLEENPATANIDRQHADDAVDLEAAISRIDALDAASSDWHESLRELIGLIEQHVEQEEQEYFPRAQKTLGKDACAALERPFLSAQQQCREQLTL